MKILEHPINRILSFVNVKIDFLGGDRSLQFNAEYNRHIQELNEVSWEYNIYLRRTNESGDHPEGHQVSECAYAAKQIRRIRPKRILDIGSYRWFVIGLTSAFDVTTIDVRDRKQISNETRITCDAKNLNLPDESFDCVVSLCAIEHFGLGRYGDEFDLYGDVKTMGEIKRVLKPGGHLILTTTVTGGKPQLVYNSHRIYNLNSIHEKFSSDFEIVDETFFSHDKDQVIKDYEIVDKPTFWDVYLGCWRKI